MARGNVARSADLPDDRQRPVQAVDDPVLSSPYEEPKEHWVYTDGVPSKAPGRRPASYYYTVAPGKGAAQKDLFAEEQRVPLPLVNRLRQDVRRWRESGYRGTSSSVTRELLAHWWASDRFRRLFFCQMEAAETLIYLLELRLTGRTSRTGFQKFELSDENLKDLLAGKTPDFEEIRGQITGELFSLASLIDPPADESLLPLRRLGCKMATGSGKTVIMAMMIAWAFCNRGQNRESREFPSGVLVCCPNLTVKERLQVLRPEARGNYYDEFDIVPGKYRDLLNLGRVLVTNWHVFAPTSPHKEGDKPYAVVDKGEETNDAFARNRLKELADRLPILVLNDEGHHCWRPRPLDEEEKAAAKKLTGEEKEAFEQEQEEARVWLDGLDKINNAGLIGDGKPCILATVDLSATPFYLSASGHPEGSPFPWLVSDFGLVDAIESGIVKIPRLPIRDDQENKDEAGRPDPKYFRLWRHITEGLDKKELRPNGKPKPEAAYREAEGALQTLYSQWLERFKLVRDAKPHEEAIPPVLIVVCDNTEIAEYFFRQISGEHLEEVVVREGKKKGQTEKQTVYRDSAFREFANSAMRKHTIQIDSRMLEKLEAEEGSSKDKAAEELRTVIATVGKRGQPGEHVRCVVSVSMLTEGWDASNVTHILGVRAFGSQLLCEQVVGRGLRRMNYTPDPHTGKLPAEHVDVYGIPFSLIPFKAQPREPGEDKPKNHVFAMPERKHMEMRFPVVESYVYGLPAGAALIQCDVDKLDGFRVDDEPTQVYLLPTRGYNEDPSAIKTTGWVKQDRQLYYEQVHFQQILFNLTQLILDELVQGAQASEKDKAWARLQARHQLFPQVYRIVTEYVDRKVTFNAGVDKRELGLQKYSRLLVERIRDGILPATAPESAPLLPVLNSFREYQSTSIVDFSTVRPVVRLSKSHLNAAAVLSKEEKWAIEALEDLDCVEFFSPNDRRILTIPYDYLDIGHTYVPDFLVRLRGGCTVMLEIKGHGGELHHEDAVPAKNAAARKWVAALNNYKRFGLWAFEICHAQAGDSQWAFTRKVKAALEKHAAAAPALPFARVESPSPAERWKTCVPLVTLKAAAGGFSEEQAQAELPLSEDIEWVTFESSHRFSEGMFVAHVRGKSMEPKIPDGSWCLFRPAPQGSRNGRILLVASREIQDPEHTGRYTLKAYESEKAASGDSWKHTRITLKPLNPDFEPIVLTPESEDSVRVVAEFLGLLQG